jgi:predicted TIM-barrel fold metal-dependent hydrolase
VPLEPPLFTEGLSVPPIRRYGGPIIDAHSHIDDVDVARQLFAVAADFGVRTIVGVARLDAIPAIQQEFGEAYRPIVRSDQTIVADPAHLTRENVRLVREARRLGAVGVKFWFAPRFWDENHFRLDDPALAPVFDAISDLGLVALVHVADPDCFFDNQYADASRFGTKPEQYEPLEAVLVRHPHLKLQGAHFGGDPENLGHIGRLLDAYPNYCVDSSATKWMTRELGRQREAARRFIIDRADRIIFGTDLVAFKEARAVDYASRYWAHRWLWEGEGVRPSPVPDPCSPTPPGPQITGLALPDDVLAKLYTENARQWFGLELAHCRTQRP